MRCDDPALVAANATALKVHLRVVPIGHTTYRVVTLRPSSGVRFASNYFHDTWHIITGVAGAHVLGRLLWGLAFQRQPGTLVLIEAPHLVPTPFEADPSIPLLLIPAGLTRFDPDDLRRLARTLRRAAVAPRTIRWHTFGLLDAFSPPVHRHARYPACPRHPDADLARERISQRAGFLCYTAPPAILRDQARDIFWTPAGRYGSYQPLAVRRHGDWHFDGELQVLPDFDDAVAAAQVARRELIGDRTIGADAERQAIFVQRTAVETRRRRAYEAAKQ